MSEQRPRRRTARGSTAGIPFRLTRGTYSAFSVEGLPTIDTAEFAHLVTIKDVAAASKSIDKTLRSPTSCYVAVSEAEHIFYRDQQDRVLWRFREGRCLRGAE